MWLFFYFSSPIYCFYLNTVVSCYNKMGHNGIKRGSTKKSRKPSTNERLYIYV